MSDVKALLEQATPLPWSIVGGRFPKSWMGSAGDGRGGFTYDVEDAALIVYAVNRLPAYEAAVEALERLVRQEYPDLPLHEIAATWGSATDEEVAALARLREEVPA